MEHAIVQMHNNCLIFTQMENLITKNIPYVYKKKLKFYCHLLKLKILSGNQKKRETEVHTVMGKI